MRVCQFRHFGKWTTLRGNLTAACQEERHSILQTLCGLSNSRLQWKGLSG